ncbi:MAG: glucosyltransferase domain-containing protein [Gemmiger sp.]|uniref:glucosyltransferase domain-containing protein n=1 Tax=Gemmiger sp. TaxID=2049027 RepID=UPI002E75B743|nr:glucosyltransferase domain-containing protein [Gemmiger sp.]MEE0800515.1 glucosyltransferase domain-containing protein [Gemmiger sp.]
MGEEMLCFYRNRLQKEYKIAFLATFILAMLIHLYKFTNTLPNHDSVYNYYSDQNILDLGRWALSWACGISSYWDLPWIIGLLSCVFIALTVVVVVALFQLKNPILIGLIGALLAASPATTETFFFLFTADGYMIAMFLAALGVYFSRIGEKRKSRWLLSGACICVSCGIYQAYVSFALVLAVCYFIDALFQNNHSKQDALKWILRQVIIYSVSLAVYYGIWRLCMQLSGTVTKDYQGISEVGKISAGLLISGLVNSVKTTILYFLQWDVLAYGFTLYSVLSILFLLVLVVGLLISYLKSKVWQRKWAVALLVLCLIAIIPFSCIWHFASDSVGYRPMMLQSLTLLFVLTAVLYERWAKQAVKNVVCLFLILIVFNNALMANISYFYMNLSYERTYADGVEMMSEIHDLQDEYEIDNIAVVGNRLAEVQWPISDPETSNVGPSGKIHMLSTLIETNLFIDAEHTIPFLKATFGMDLEPVTTARLTELSESADVQAMGCWPEKDSIAVMDGTLVIKLANTGT